MKDSVKRNSHRFICILLLSVFSAIHLIACTNKDDADNEAANSSLVMSEEATDPDRISVRVEKTTDDSRYAKDIITFVDEDSYVEGIINCKRSNETEIIPGQKFHIYSAEINDYMLEVDVPQDEDGFSLIIDYDEGMISINGLE